MKIIKNFFNRSIENFGESDSKFKKDVRRILDVVFLCILLSYASQVYWTD